MLENVASHVANFSLPRLCYIGDVPIESSYHGSALLYRLLKNYPPESLLVIEQGVECSIPSRRLLGVRYEHSNINGLRWLNTRFAPLVASWLSVSAGMRLGRVRSFIGNFRPQAVLTVAHGFSWLTAASAAQRWQLPLVLIVHDDWTLAANLVGPLKSWLNHRFGEVYCQSASRLCVSPFMVEDFEQRYGIKGTTLYPSREEGTPRLQEHSAPGPQTRPFTVAYAGTLHTADFIRQLAALGRILRELEGRLLLFGPHDVRALSAMGVNLQNVEIGGVLNSAELIRRLRLDADVLFLPMSFRPEDSKWFALNFPSKLTDYTATALPILIWGPKESSAVKWATMEPGVAAVVTNPDECVMAATLNRLRQDANWRSRLGSAAAEAGQRYFSPESAQSTFYESLHRLPKQSESCISALKN
jgi:glycosyltransferase involved in cell wall biosynthesis